MKSILVFAGSSSKTSINKKLAIYASTFVTNASPNVLDLNDFELPVFSVDKEAEIGSPKPAQIFLNEIKASAGIILSLAEHNGAYSVAFKNILDWTSRIDGKFWSEKPMLLMAASPGSRGGQSVLGMAKNRFQYMGGNIVSTFSLPLFNDNFSEEGIKNEELKAALLEAVTIFKTEI